MKAYVISLEPPHTKLAELAAHGIEAEFVRGVDGRKIDRDELLKATTGRAPSSSVHRWLHAIAPSTALAIGLSHLHVWQTWVSTAEEEYALIFEDDVVLEEGFLRSVNRLIHEGYVPNDTDVLFLGHFFGEEKNSWLTTLFPTYPSAGPVNEYVSIPSVTFATHAYLITRSGARRLIDWVQREGIFYHLDTMLQMNSDRSGLHVYVSRPRLAYQTSSCDQSTSTNASSSSPHPYLLHKWAETVHIDRGVSLKFLLNLSVCQFGSVCLSILNLLFLVVGVMVALLPIPRVMLVGMMGILVWMSLPLFLRTSC